MPLHTTGDATITTVRSIFPPSTSTTNQMVLDMLLERAKLLNKRGASKSLDWKQERKFKSKLLWVKKDISSNRASNMLFLMLLCMEE
nr:hypothetical protein CFP56_15997 [Quercus suber]